MKTHILLGAVAACALVTETPALAATTIVNFALEDNGAALATGSFSFDSSLTGALSYADLDSFSLTLPNETYDLAFVNSGGFSQFYYFGYNSTSGSFQSTTIDGYSQILSAIKTGFSDGFFVRDDETYTTFRNYNPESFDVYFTNVTVTSRTVDGAVPEPAIWAMMLIGFGAVGGAMRSAKRRQRVTVSYA